MAWFYYRASIGSHRPWNGYRYGKSPSTVLANFTPADAGPHRDRDRQRKTICIMMITAHCNSSKHHHMCLHAHIVFYSLSVTLNCCSNLLCVASSPRTELNYIQVSSRPCFAPVDSRRCGLILPVVPHRNPRLAVPARGRLPVGQSSSRSGAKSTRYNNENDTMPPQSWKAACSTY
jgi:hypothetical protein